jgi:cytoplasmic iron level regulating protein YaaA (DUF328/UPF0246 family)
MLAIISPAKTLDFDAPAQTRTHSMPDFLPDSTALIDRLRDLAPDEIGELMGISTKLADLNYTRYTNWGTPFTVKNAKQAMLAFKGDVYMGLEAWNMSQRDLTWAQRHVRILSGLYGLLRPLDLIQPYRLEMGTQLANRSGKDLYAFWGDKLTNALNADLGAEKSRVLINLASAEYYQALDPDRIEARIITPTFLDLKNGRYKFVSFFAKKARGYMTRYIVSKRISTLKALKAFDCDGYRYCQAQSAGDDWVFLRG